MTRAAFERLVQEGAERIPAQFRKHLDEIPVIVEGEPTRAQRRAARVGRGTGLLGLYVGTPHTKRAGLPYRLPDTVTLFQGPIERACGGNAERIREEVAHTLWHELAHALGMDEHRVRRAERTRRSQSRTR